MEKNQNPILVNSIIEHWQGKKYDEASKLIMQTNIFEIRDLKEHIELNLLTRQALNHVLESLSLEEWTLYKGLIAINKNNDDAILTLLIKKYQEEFYAADLEKKIVMFEETKRDYEKSFRRNQNHLDFMKKNWEHLVHLINDLETGLKIYEAVDMGDPQNPWCLVAALKTIEASHKNKTVAEIENLYPILVKHFQNVLGSPIKTILAQAILKKMQE